MGKASPKRYSTYVVHVMRSDYAQGIHENYRLERATYGFVFQLWKRVVREGCQAGLFYWDADGDCTRLCATDGYNIDRDTPAE